MSFVQNMILNNKVKDKNQLDSVMSSSKHLIPPTPSKPAVPV